MNDKFNNAVVEYDVHNTPVRLSPSIIRNYLVSGNGKVTDQEIVMFINLCRAQRLNPFIREAYLIKFGSQAATMVVGKDVFTKRASQNPNFDGFEAGITVINEKGNIERRSGSLALPTDEIIGGWARVHVKRYDVPIEAEVAFSEYCQVKDGRPMALWATKPATMIRKVALVQALREAFPEDLQALYDASEMPVSDIKLEELPVIIDEPSEEPMSDKPEENQE